MRTSALQFRYKPIVACGLAALFVSFASPNTFAKPDSPGSFGVKVQYNIHDLSTPEGAEKIYRRIKVAARRVCFNTMESWDAARTKHYWQCYAESLNRAVDSINSKNLTALHLQDAKQKRPG